MFFLLSGSYLYYLSGNIKASNLGHTQKTKHPLILKTLETFLRRYLVALSHSLKSGRQILYLFPSSLENNYI